MGARAHAVHSRRCLSRRRTGAGGLIVQFCVHFVSTYCLSSKQWDIASHMEDVPCILPRSTSCIR